MLEIRPQALFKAEKKLSISMSGFPTLPRRIDSLALSGVRRIFLGGQQPIFISFGWGHEPILRNVNMESYGTSENLGWGHGRLGPPPDATARASQ